MLKCYSLKHLRSCFLATVISLAQINSYKIEGLVILTLTKTKRPPRNYHSSTSNRIRQLVPKSKVLCLVFFTLMTRLHNLGFVAKLYTTFHRDHLREEDLQRNSLHDMRQDYSCPLLPSGSLGHPQERMPRQMGDGRADGTYCLQVRRWAFHGRSLFPDRESSCS